MSSDRLTADEAAARLGVRKATLYTYVSRGLLRAFGAGRTRTYLRAEVEALRAQAAAGRGRDAAATSSMDFGAPVLASAITSIDVEGPNYRGHAAVTLAERHTPFEAVAELLWGAPLGAAPTWPSPSAFDADAIAALTPPGAGVYATLAVVVAATAAADPLRLLRGPDAAKVAGRALIRRLAAGVALAVGDRGSLHARLYGALAAPTVAGALRAAVGGPRSAEPVIEGCLVLVADHELNPSTFAARIAAGTGADDAACVAAALATLSGPRHGGLTERIEGVADEVPHATAALRWLAERAAAGDEVPGFGHPLYAEGDPRAAWMLGEARRHDADAIEGLLTVVDAMATAGHGPPVLDVGLVAACRAARLPRGAAAAVFAVGRCAGWIAHAAEQRASGQLLRPRARYVGP